MRFVAIGVVTLALAGLVAGCSSGSPGTIDSPGSPEGSDSARGEDSGQTGSLEPDDDDEGNDCHVANDCDAYAAEELARFTLPTTNRVHFEAAECKEISVEGGDVGTSCACRVDGGDGSFYVGRVVPLCARGRVGDCLFAEDEIGDCDVTDATGCDAVCAELEQRKEDDAALSFDASILYTACGPQGCKTVLQIGERCFADRSYLFGRSYDCSLGGEAILAAEQEVRHPPVGEHQGQGQGGFGGAGSN